MSPRPPDLAVLAAGLALGVLGDATLRVGPWGANATLMALTLLALMYLLQRRHGAPAVSRWPCAAAIAIAAIGMAWRDAVLLKLLDIAVLGVAFGLLAAERAGVMRTLSADAARLGSTALHAAYGAPVLVLSDVRWRDMGFRPLLGVAASTIRGGALAVPIVLTFALLLASADAVFAARLSEWIAIDLATLAGHLAVISVLTWIATGVLRASVLPDPAVLRVPPRPAWLSLGGIEIGIVLGLVDLLFAAFVWIQVQYLFGGEAWVHGVAGLTYSEYARRGFFELVTVSALVLALLLATHWLSQPGPRVPFAVLASVQIAFVMVMLVSAVRRMRLYQEEYGQTELRFYAMAFMLWLGAVLLWFLPTVLRGRRDLFARGALTMATVAIAALHVVDPERRIAETNLGDHPRRDVRYTLHLGADAVGPMLDALPRLSLADQKVVARRLLARWTGSEDWRTWSSARAHARRHVRAAEPYLRQLAGGDAPGVDAR